MASHGSHQADLQNTGTVVAMFLDHLSLIAEVNLVIRLWNSADEKPSEVACFRSCCILIAFAVKSVYQTIGGATKYHRIL